MISSQTTQIKVTLPDELYSYLKSKADGFGLNLATYIRHLVISDVRDVAVPAFPMSEKTEKVALKALGDYRAGKTRKMGDINKYLSRLTQG